MLKERVFHEDLRTASRMVYASREKLRAKMDERGLTEGNLWFIAEHFGPVSGGYECILEPIKIK
jgi:hypothetical protein